MTQDTPTDRFRLVAVNLDEASIGRSSPDIDHERAVAIYDLIEENSFKPIGHEGGPYALHLSLAENRLVFDVRLRDGAEHGRVALALAPLRRDRKSTRLNSSHVSESRMPSSA